MFICRSSDLSRRAAPILLFIVAIALYPAPAHCADYYVAPGGDDANPGTIAAPVATLQRGQALASPGDTVFVRGGTYHVTEAQISRVYQSLFACVSFFDKSGTQAAPINYFAYPGEQPHFDFSAVKPANERVVGIYVTGSWLHIKGLEMTGIQVTILTHTESYCIYSFGNHNIFEQLKLHDNVGTGLRHRTGGNNLFLNCDAWDNWDNVSENMLGGNSDGFGCHPTAGGTGNVFRGCRSWFNSDDGYDVLGAAESVTFDHCWAFYNGYSPSFQSLGDGNGFKGGGGGSTADNMIRFCLSVKNKASGFYSNHNLHGSHWINNSAYRNSTNYNMLNRLMDNVTDVPGFGHFMRNNLGYKGGQELTNIDKAACDLSHNYFDLNPTITDNDFESLDESLLVAPRQADGSLPDNGFMKLKPGSGLIDLGIDVGYPFAGAAPDLGAFENGLPGPSAGLGWLAYR